jgi:capsular polysaccharide transport system permease protein
VDKEQADKGALTPARLVKPVVQATLTPSAPRTVTSPVSRITKQADVVRPTVPNARMELRHKLILLSFLLVVGLPTLISAWYLWTRAEDQYISTVSFSVRKEDASPSIDILGGITQLASNTTASDTDILYDFLGSEDIVSKIDKTMDLRARFSKAWPDDPVFALNPSLPIEDLTKYWRRQVRVLYDTSTRLITLQVAAFTREDAYEIARAAFDESSRTINRLSDIAREDTTRFARTELEKAQARLTETRQALTTFRMRTQIVDPKADLSGQMGVLNSLQAQLAEALITLDTLHNVARDDDHRVTQAKQKIDAIRARIVDERAKLGAAGEGPAGESYAQLMAEYEKLASDMEFAEVTFRSAQAGYETAVAEAMRQSRYLAAHIEPKIAESSLAPRRAWLLASVFGVMLLGWSIMLLIYYSIRDRR